MCATLKPGPQQLVIFRLGKEEYGFEISVVKEIRDVEQIAKVHRSPTYIEGVMNLRGKLVTVIDLRRRLALEAKAPDELTKIIVVDAPDAPVGFLVDEVKEVAWVTPDKIEKAPEIIASGIEADYVTGIAKMGDRLITIVDPVSVLELSTEI